MGGRLQSSLRIARLKGHVQCRRLTLRSSGLPTAAAELKRCYDFQCQELVAIFLGFHAVLVLRASEKPEPVICDG